MVSLVPMTSPVDTNTDGCRKLVERGTVGPVLSSLETVRRDAWMKDDEGNLERTSVYGIINVYTPRNYRREFTSRSSPA